MKHEQTWRGEVESRKWRIVHENDRWSLFLLLDESTNDIDINLSGKGIVGGAHHKTHLNIYEFQLDGNLNESELKNSLQSVYDHYTSVQSKLDN
jgi:hypothetical protein